MSAHAQQQAQPSTSGLPLPRFVSLRAEEVNLRTGPGVRYPIEWVINKRELPVEIIAEFDTWRKIRDYQGTDGWVHQTMLTGRRTMIVMGPGTKKLRRQDNETAAALVNAEAGVIGRLLQCPRNSEFCRVEVEGYQGWLRRDEFWGVYKGEFIE
jgi:SH3-like domain-containing protein